MKNLSVGSVCFAALVASFLILAGCSGTAPNGGNTASNTTANGSAANEAPKTEYPPLASALADAELENLDGTKTKISDRKGKVVLVNIWGIWCIPCIAEMPHLIALQNQYRDQGFEIIGMNIGADDQGTPEELDEIKKFAEKKKLNYTIVRSSLPVTKHFYAITGQGVVPQTIIVNRQGQLRGAFIGGGGQVINKMKETLAKVMEE